MKKSNPLKTVITIGIFVIIWIMVIIFGEEINRFFKANEDFYIKIIIIMVLILCTGILYFWYREYKIRKQAMTKILTEIPPQKGIVIDILIYQYFTKSTDDGWERHYNFYPIVKNTINNKLYVSFERYSYGKYRCKIYLEYIFKIKISIKK